MGLLNACIALLAMEISLTSAASNLLEKIKADPDLSQVNFRDENGKQRFLMNNICVTDV